MSAALNSILTYRKYPKEVETHIFWGKITILKYCMIFVEPLPCSLPLPHSTRLLWKERKFLDFWKMEEMEEIEEMKRGMKISHAFPSFPPLPYWLCQHQVLDWIFSWSSHVGGCFEGVGGVVFWVVEVAEVREYFFLLELPCSHCSLSWRWKAWEVVWELKQFWKMTLMWCLESESSRADGKRVPLVEALAHGSLWLSVAGFEWWCGGQDTKETEVWYLS